ncbi:MAG TPA: hypothetical protein VFS43_13685 [Polyangiaceae bacterium]|nr:hypothetical protein [Polyangiaceae bacterium]
MHKALASSIASAVLLLASATHTLVSRGAPPAAPGGGEAALATAAEAAPPAAPEGAPAALAVARAESAPVAEAPRPPRAKGTRVGGGRGAFYVPSDLSAPGGTFDLVIHFHGANETVEPRFDASNLNAVLYTLNLGIGSGKYEAMFPDGKALGRALAEAEAVLRKRVPALAGARVGRVALSAWSAGYGAVARVLAYPEAAERVDAVLLADAPHTGFEPGTRQVSQLGLAPYVSYGRKAVAGERLMVVTHSQIETPDYASTTRTARALVAALGLPEGEPAPADNPKMVMYEREELGSMHVFGFRGGDAPAHCQHLYNIGLHHWSFLGARWGTPEAPADGALALADRPEGGARAGTPD